MVLTYNGKDYEGTRRTGGYSEKSWSMKITFSGYRQSTARCRGAACNARNYTVLTAQTLESWSRQEGSDSSDLADLAIWASSSTCSRRGSHGPSQSLKKRRTANAWSRSLLCYVRPGYFQQSEEIFRSHHQYGLDGDRLESIYRIVNVEDPWWSFGVPTNQFQLERFL